MKRVRVFMAVVMVAAFTMVLFSPVIAQEKKPVTIADILKKAKCPLTDEQTKKLKEFKPGGDREAFRAVYELFDEKQTAALKAVLGANPGRDGGPERPKNLFFVVMFENAGCPFTEDQIAKMKELPAGRESFEKMRELYTDKQKEVSESMFNR